MADNKVSFFWVDACVALLLLLLFFSAALFPWCDAISSSSAGDGGIDCDVVLGDLATAAIVGSGAGALRILSFPPGPGPRADEVSCCCCLVVDRDVDGDAAVVGKPRRPTAGCR